MSRAYDFVVCGAGIAGAAASYALARAGARRILVVDAGPPLELTTARSTECYRNWWPDAAMAALMSRSIDLLEERAAASDNVFRMNRRGYVYLTADPARVEPLRSQAVATSRAVGEPLRVHPEDASPYRPSPADGFQGAPRGADLLLDPDLIRRHFPCVCDRAVAALHARRAGWLSAQQLGMHLLEEAQRAAVELRRARVTGIEMLHGAVCGVRLDSGETIATSCFVDAAGPHLGHIARFVGLELPIHNELHLKVAFRDTRRAVPRDAPLLIWTDRQRLAWTEEERALLASDRDRRWMLDEFPAGAHTRPEGGPESPMLLFLWEYKPVVLEPVWPPPLDEDYPEIVLRGMAAMVPALRDYFGRAPQPILDGGYYTKTPENRPLIGPTPVGGFFLMGAFSGYGIMAACGAGELLARTVLGAPLPDYAPAFALARYEDPSYVAGLGAGGPSGQL